MSAYLVGMNTFTDYYELLGIPANASTDAIKAAFKKLALQYHPDVYKGEDAQERMRVLLLAYKTLSDPKERQLYDARHSEYNLDNHMPRAAYSTKDSATRQGSMSGTKRPASPAARRDRQRQYDFPDLRDGQPARVDLVAITYRLSPAEAQTLRQEGLLRGVAPETEGADCYCHRCHHRWNGEREGKRSCPQCHASDWSEYLLLRCVHCCAIFESEQIRYEIGTYSYGNGTVAELCPPYELFPLCPYCNTAHWCPAEEVRVGKLREHLARRAARLKLLWVSAAVIALMVLGGLVVSGVLR